jgi:hypothetical protein
MMIWMYGWQIHREMGDRMGCPLGMITRHRQCPRNKTISVKTGEPGMLVGVLARLKTGCRESELANHATTWLLHSPCADDLCALERRESVDDGPANQSSPVFCSCPGSRVARIRGRDDAMAARSFPSRERALTDPGHSYLLCTSHTLSVCKCCFG